MVTVCMFILKRSGGLEEPGKLIHIQSLTQKKQI
jgi:hypothetical protein